jgi:phytoene synthase
MPMPEAPQHQHLQQSERFASDADRADCRRLIRVGSRSFYAASLLLPSAVREAAYALYAFCRLSDDMVDVEGGTMDAIAHLSARLDTVYAGRPANASIDRAFADVVARYALPRSLPEALIEGLAWDVTGVRCETEADLYAYAARVAGSVGAMMTVLMGARDDETVARACDLGVAMQLTNIARDIGEDARSGRLYLPRTWLRERGIDADAWLARPIYTPAIGDVVCRLLETADTLYVRAVSGIGGLPALCRPAIFAARHLYREIGVEVARRGFDSVSARARVAGRRKLQLAAWAVLDATWLTAARFAAATRPHPPLAETAYLVAAVTASDPARRSVVATSRVTHRILWVAELFATLEARDRMGVNREFG